MGHEARGPQSSIDPQKNIEKSDSVTTLRKITLGCELQILTGSYEELSISVVVTAQYPWRKMVRVSRNLYGKPELMTKRCNFALVALPKPPISFESRSGRKKAQRNIVNTPTHTAIRERI